MSKQPNITILGSGFAALTAIRTIRKHAPDAQLTVIAPKAEFTYLPSLIWIPTGLREGQQLTHPLNDFFTRNRIKFVAAHVTGLTDDARVVITDQQEHIANDALLIASGGHFLKKLPGIEHAITLCEGIPAANTIRQKLQQLEHGNIAFGFGSNPAEPSAARGGPMFELLFGIDTWLTQQNKRAAINLTFFNPASLPGKRLGEKAAQNMLLHMKQRNINTHLGHKITAFTEHTVETEGGTIDADLILFMPGMTGPAWLNNTTLPQSAGGFIQADEFCRVTGFERTYVAGDAGSFPGPDWLPKQAHMADLQAKSAAINMLRELDNQAPVSTPQAELVCIIDDGKTGTLVFHNAKHAFILPPLRLFHWAKMWFEKQYIGQYR